MPIKVRVGQTEAVKILSSKGGGSVSTQDAVNVIGGIGSVSQLSVSGLSTFTGIGTFADDLYVGDKLYVGDDLTVTNDINLGDILYVTQSGGIQNTGGFTNLYGNTVIGGVNDSLSIIAPTEISGNLNATGITTISNLYGDASNLTGVTVTGIDTTGLSKFNRITTSGVSTFYGQVEIAENTTFFVGGFSIKHFGNPINSIAMLANTGDQIIQQASGITLQDTTGNKYFKAASTNTRLFHDGSERLRTTTNGIEITNGAAGAAGTITALDGIFTGNVSVAGTLTYEDVTNVDSVGIITAQSGVRISDGGLMITAGISTFGAIATFTNDVFVDGTLTAGIIDGGSF
tara:strand:- start:365 stop:1399 length:1035 start_codon:yes stop_codon:yes gene_type:complete